MTTSRNRQPPHTPRRWFSHPVLSLMIATSWLLLQGSLAPASLLWAAILGIGLPWLVHPFIWPGPPPRRLRAVLRLTLVVLWDIVVANLTVAKIVLDPRREPQPAWIELPYTLQDPRAVVLLATIITTTPGTVSATIDEQRQIIAVHVLDTDDPAAVASEITSRYERPLKEIFE